MRPAPADTMWMRKLLTGYRASDLLAIPALAIAYLLLAIVVMKFGTVQGNVTLIWPSLGFGLFVLLRFGPRLWPGVFLGALSAGFWINDPWFLSFTIATANTLDALLGCWLLLPLSGRIKLRRLPDYFQLVLFGGLLAPLASAIIGPAALHLSGYISPDQIPVSILRWWMANTLGMILLTPALIILEQRHNLLARNEYLWEGLVLLTLSITVGLIVFSGMHPDWLPAGLAPMSFWVTPFLIWSAIRFGRHGVSLQLLMYFALSLFGISMHQGIFSHDLLTSGLINFWFYHLTTSVAGMTLGIALHERHEAEAEVCSEKARLRDVVDAIPFPLFLKDANGAYLLVNQAFLRPFNRPEDDIIGKRSPDLMPPDGAVQMDRQDQQVLSLGIAQRVEEWMQFPNGSRELHQITKVPMRDAGGHVIGLVGLSQNITERHAMELERARLYDTIAASHDEVYLFDADTLRFRFMNSTALQHLGYSLEQSRALTPLDLEPFFTPEDFRGLLAPLFMHEKTVQIFETMHKRMDGSLYPVEVHLQLFENGQERYFLAIVQDISHRIDAEHALRLAASVFEHSKQSILITDAETRIVSVNQAFTRITGYAEADVLGKNPRLLSSGTHGESFYRTMWDTILATGGWSGEVWNRRKDGTLYAQWLDICMVKDATGRVTNFIGLSYDITERKAAEENIRRLAQHDFLTGLPNRILFYDRFEQALAAAKRNQSHFALFFLDLNNFKHINDTHGHRFGDELLKAVAQRLSDSMRATDTTCRLGGDEFVILVPEIEHPEQAQKLQQILVEKFDAPCVVGGQPVQISFSIGHAVYPQDGDSMDALLEAADSAMYQVKKAEKARESDPA